MIYSEKQYKELEEKLKKEINKLKKDNEITKKENKILKQQNKQKDEVIHDLDRYDYRDQCQSQKIEIENLKKKSKRLRREIRDCENQLRKK